MLLDYLSRNCRVHWSFHIDLPDLFQEKYEYDKFVIETAHKIQEIQQDFNNLSDENKIKFQNDVMRAFMIKGIEGVSEYFSQWK